MKRILITLLIASLGLVACQPVKQSTVNGGTAMVGTNVVVKIIQSDISSGKLEGQIKLLCQGAVLGCRLAKVDGYEHEFALVNAWATRVNTLLKGQTTPLTTAQMQAETTSVGIKVTDTVALDAISNILSTVESAFVSWGATPAEIYSGLLQASAGAMEGTAQFAGQ